MNRSNYDDIFIRNVYVSLLEILTTELSIEQMIGDKIENHRVKFMVSAGNSEQFMKDFFSSIPENLCDVYKAEGNYETLPFGVLHVPPQVQVMVNELANKFERGKFTQKEFDANNKIIGVGYSSRLMVLPLNITFKIDIKVATLNQLFKVWESIIDSFFQTRTRNFMYKGNKIQVMFRFPDQIDAKKNEQFDFTTTDNTAMVSFSVVAETNYPSFDKFSLTKVDNTIERYNVATTNAATDEVIGDRNGTFIDENGIT